MGSSVSATTAARYIGLQVRIAQNVSDLYVNSASLTRTFDNNIVSVDIESAVSSGSTIEMGAVCASCATIKLRTVSSNDATVIKRGSYVSFIALGNTTSHPSAG
ncbi:MAG: hypothetical protein IJS17_00735, partial [Clostridia bacterium]|nr:hypothetical protein [Clostridia bacterium]